MTFAVRLDPLIEKRLKLLAQKTNRSQSYYVRKGIEQILEDEEDYADAVSAYESYIRSGQKGLSIDEMRAALKND